MRIIHSFHTKNHLDQFGSSPSRMNLSNSTDPNNKTNKHSIEEEVLADDPTVKKAKKRKATGVNLLVGRKVS
jgi:hypothetical protein